MKSILPVLLAVFSCALVGCETPEFSVYKRSIAQPDFGIEVLDKSVLEGFYQKLGYGDTPRGLINIYSSVCPGISAWEIDTKADCKSSKKSRNDFVQFISLVKIDDRLFAEIKIKTSFWNFPQYSLVEVVMLPKTMVLATMKFDPELLAKSRLDYRRGELGGMFTDPRIVTEVLNRPGQARELLKSMKHSNGLYDTFVVRPVTYEVIDRIQTTTRLLGVRQYEKFPEESCASDLSS